VGCAHFSDSEQVVQGGGERCYKDLTLQAVAVLHTHDFFMR
jgi:hypothetical protein